MPLEQELAYFDSIASDLLANHRGQFAAIRGRKLLGTFTTFAEAFDAGVKAWGTEPFLVKVISDADGFIQLPALTVGMLSARP